MGNKKSIVILGGGACGLTAAWELSRNHASEAEVVVVEKLDRPGGLCITHEHKGWRFDLGGHRFISTNRELTDDMVEMMGDEFLLAERNSVILMRGQHFLYPLSGKDIFTKLPLSTNAHAFASYLWHNNKARLPWVRDESFEDWVVNRFGRKLYDLFFGPYTEKLWGVHPSQISSDWASQRISLLNLWDVAMRLVKFRKSEVRTYAMKYYYPKKGIGQMFDIMTDDIRRRGADVLLGAEVTGFVTENNAVKAVKVKEGGREREIPCDFVISTIPLTTASRFLHSDGPFALRQSIGSLKFRAMRFMNILLDMPDISPYTWQYVSESRYLMTRLQEPKRRSPFSAPEGKTSLMLEICCNKGDMIWKASEDEIFERCIKDMAHLGLPVKDKVLGYFSTYAEDAYPVYSLDYNRHRSRLLEAASRYSNLLTCGRQGVFRYIFMDIAMEMGIRAAQAVMKGTVEQERETICMWRREEGYIETKAVTA